MLRLSLCFLFFISIIEATAQGVIRGKVTDENGETIIGATVVLKVNPPVGVFTDLDGNFSISRSDSSEVLLQISYVGFLTIEEKVSLKQNKVLSKNYVLKSKENIINQVEIVAEAVKNKDYYLENIKRKSAVSLDYISSETMKKTGDNNVTAALSRVSGVSTNGSFITVRGIGDRYLKTNINGLRIPTLDPFTNNIKLDLIPSSLVDNIVISKTASPELPGDWAGAYISVETKDFPDKLSITFESNVEFNFQNLRSQILQSKKSSTDWLGYDNGFREINHDDFRPAVINPSQYQQMAALGLTDFYESLGITEGSAWNETYFKLGLVELGLLDKALINNTASYNIARDNFNTNQFRGEAFAIINKDASEFGQSVQNNWDLSSADTPLNFSQAFTVGNQVNVFGKPLGFLAGFRYGRSFLNDPNAVAQRAAIDVNGETFIPFDWNQQVSRETNGWSGVLNLSFKPSANHSLTFLFMPNMIGVNNLRSDSLYDETASYIRIFSKNQFYEERQQLVYQFRSEHYIPSRAIKINLDASYTDGESSVPDFNGYRYFFNNDSLLELDRVYSNTSRFFRYLDEDLLDTRVQVEFPLFEKPGFKRKVKLGGGYLLNRKDNTQYNYLLSFTVPDKFIIENGNVDPYFSLDQFAINSSNQLVSYYQRDENPGNRSIGASSIVSAFLMTDYNVTKRLRFSGGFRIEQANIYTDVYLYDSLGYAKGDGRRFFPGGLVPLAPNPGVLDEFDFLPSISIIRSLSENEDLPFNLRFNFSRTVARPSMRELSEIIVMDYELRAPVFGNSDLKSVDITNYDIRAEKYFKGGNNVSVSVFYKDFRNHIELVNSNIGFSWQNIDKSRAFGLELEGRKKIGSKLELMSNLTFTNSLSEFVQNRLELNNGIKTYIPFDTVSRSMFGQAPYVINGILSYTEDKAGLTATISYNRQGPRLSIASNDGAPDIYELPRNLLDLKLTKSLGKFFSISLRVRDILNSPIRRSYKFDEGWIIDYDSFRFGTFYQIGITYKI